MWVGKGTPAPWLQDVLSVGSLDAVESARLRVPLLDNETSLRVNRLINAVRSQRPMVLSFPRVLSPKDPQEARVLAMLTEDRAQTTMNYVEFLCHIHRQIQQRFN